MESELESAAERVLSSRVLVRSEQLKQLLGYLVSAAAQGGETAFTEVVIGATVFRRRNFDPRVDTIVRAQMLRLRRKLDQYYEDEGKEEPLRISFQRNSYRPFLHPNHTPVAEQSDSDERLSVEAGAIGKSAPAWKTGIAGALAGAVLVSIGFLLWSHFAALAVPRHPALAHRLWIDLPARPVTVVYPGFLFFRSNAGIERDFELNLSQDLPNAQGRLKRWPVVPQWDNWVPSADVHTILELKTLLSQSGQKTQIQSGRTLSLSDLRGRNTVILGAPRAVPALAEFLKPLPFHLSPVAPGAAWRGFEDESSKGGEPEVYDAGDRTELEEFHETWPDYALLTHVRLKDGGEVWSIFGNRTQTGNFVVDKLLDPEFLRHLETAYPESGAKDYQVLQIVFRVDYTNGLPHGAAPISHRIR